MPSPEERPEVDPVNDVRPVCPNCHAMLHRQDPPLSIDGLRERHAPMLTNTEIAELRRRVVHCQRREPGVTYTGVRFTDGPLAGLLAFVLDAKVWCIGWCHVTPTGPVQVLYEHDGERYRFRGFEGGSRHRG